MCYIITEIICISLDVKIEWMLAETVASNRIEMADLSSFEEYNDRRQQPGRGRRREKKCHLQLSVCVCESTNIYSGIKKHHHHHRHPKFGRGKLERVYEIGKRSIFFSILLFLLFFFVLFVGWIRFCAKICSSCQLSVG